MKSLTWPHMHAEWVNSSIWWLNSMTQIRNERVPNSTRCSICFHFFVFLCTCVFGFWARVFRCCTQGEHAPKYWPSSIKALTECVFVHLWLFVWIQCFKARIKYFILDDCVGVFRGDRSRNGASLGSHGCIYCLIFILLLLLFVANFGK